MNRLTNALPFHLPAPTRAAAAPAAAPPQDGLAPPVDADFPPSPLARVFARPDPDRCLDAVSRMGRELLAGRADLGQDEFLEKRLEAATASSRMPDTSRAWVQLHARPQAEGTLDLDGALDVLRGPGGLVESGRGTVAIDYEHHFEMDYAPGGGFRGSRSYESAGRTEMAKFSVLQRPGAGPSDPGVVVLRQVAPGHAGPRVEGTDHDGESSSTSLYFVDDVSRLQGVAGDTSGGDVAVKQRLETMLRSLEQNSSVELRNYTTGYGRVGTTAAARVRIGGAVFTDEQGPVMGRAAALAGMALLEDRLGVSARLPGHGPTRLPDPRRKVLLGVALGAGFAAAGLGLAVLGAAITPANGWGVAALAGLVSGVGFRDSSDGYNPYIAGSYEAFRTRRRAQFWTGAAAGAGAVGAMMAGSTMGLPGLAVAGAAWAVGTTLSLARAEGSR